MANISTRLKLKYASLAAWEASALELLQGEVAFAQKTDGSIVMKVGPGTWANAKEITLSELANYYTSEEVDAAIDAIELLIGDLPEDTEATSIVEYINEKTTGIASDTALKEAQEAITALQTAVNTTIPATYATKEEAQGYADAKDDEIAAAQKAGDDAAAAVQALAEGAVAANTKAISDEVTRADNAEKALGERIDGITNETTGILAQAKEYADTKTTMAAVEAKDYATKTEAQGYANAKDEAIQNAQNTANQAKAAIDAFLDENAATDDVVNTLKEIQAGLDAGEASAASLLAEVNKIKDGTTVVPKAADADTLDGKQATDFATAAQGAKADTAVQEADLLAGGVNSDVTITKEGNSYNVQLKNAVVGSDELGGYAVKAIHMDDNTIKTGDGLTATKDTNSITIAFAEGIIFDCGGAE